MGAIAEVLAVRCRIERLLVAGAIAAVNACSDGSGPSDDAASLTVTVTMQGEGSDPDGLTIHVDGEEVAALAGAGSHTLEDVVPGSYQVALEQVAPFCQGGSARTVEVTAGATGRVTFALECIVGPGGTIFFTATPRQDPPTGRGDLISLDMVTGRRTVVASDMVASDVSPDGTRLAYIRDGSLFVADGDGSNPVPVAGIGTWSGRPRWSPDGAELVFTTRRDGVWDLFVIDATGANFRLVFPSAHEFDRRSPDWSATGRLAYQVTRPDLFSEIWTAGLDGSNEALLVPGGSARSPAWSPDGTRLAYSSGVDAVFRLHVVDADGANARLLTNLTDTFEFDPAWSPDGEWIAFDGVAVGGPDDPPPVASLRAVRPGGGPVALLNDDYGAFFLSVVRWIPGP